MKNPNLAILELVARTLGPVCDEVVFVGGCATGLLLTQERPDPIRVTEDVDIIAQALTASDYHALEAKVRARGFSNDMRPGAPICRWVYGPVTVDVMPTVQDILGFANRWYPLAVETATTVILDGDELFDHYRHALERLGQEKGTLGLIFGKAQNKFQDPAKLRRVIVDLIGAETWTILGADVKGDAYEGLLERNAQDTKSGAGQYFTPRALIQAMVECMAPKPAERICDPACGTGGFLFIAHNYITAHNKSLTRDQLKHLKEKAFTGYELVQATARVCAMNMMLHGIGSEKSVPVVVGDALAADPGERYEVVLANPPFGKKSSTVIVGEDGRTSTEKDTIERDDFWATTSNKQLNFVQHIKTLLTTHGRAAVVLPDNVLFEGGAGETIRKKLLHECDVHTLLRLPTGLFYAQGVKANVLFFEKKGASETPWTKKLWIYDLRTNKHFTLKTNPLTRADLDEFVALYQMGNRHQRQATWSPENPEGRWRAYSYDELVARDKTSLDIFWLKDESLADSDNLPAPGVIALEIVEDLQAALEQFKLIAADMAEGAIE